jgi:hypothetical protein
MVIPRIGFFVLSIFFFMSQTSWSTHHHLNCWEKFPSRLLKKFYHTRPPQARQDALLPGAVR